VITQNKLFAIGIGEILWDLLPEGKMLGGAPTNFAFHIHQMQVSAAIISAVGKDPLGEKIKSIIQEKGLVNLIQSNKHPTGTVSVTLDEAGIPNYIIHENVAWDFVETTSQGIEAAKKADAICFGTLAQRSSTTQKTIRKIIRASSIDTLKVFDINIRQHFYNRESIENSLHLANILKINEEELFLLSEMLEFQGSEYEQTDQLMDQFQLEYLALTKGSQGSWLFSQHDSSYIQTPEVKVADTVGAGDSFSAAMVAGFLYGLPFEEVHQFAVDISAFVCTREGATPLLPKQLLSRLHQ
jgi:fructokinase